MVSENQILIILNSFFGDIDKPFILSLSSCNNSSNIHFKNISLHSEITLVDDILKEIKPFFILEESLYKKHVLEY